VNKENKKGIKTMKNLKLFLAAFILVASPMALTACEDDTMLEEGAESIEEGADNLEDGAEEMSEEVSDEVDDATTSY
jgi:hypothetical protein